MSRDEARCTKAREILTDLYATDTLTETQIARAVTFVYDNGDNYSASPGNDWIWENYESLPRVIPNVEAFFRRHMKYLARIAISRKELLMLISAEHRARFLDDALKACVPFNYNWVRAAFACNVERKEVAALLRAQIEKAPKHYSPNFVQYGAGDLPPERYEQILEANTPWAMFDDMELLEVLRLCMNDPDSAKYFFSQRKALTLRYSEEDANQLCKEAADHVNSVIQLELRDLRLLPLDTRLRLARQITLETFRSDETTAMFICDVVMDFTDREQKPNPANYNELLDKIDWAPTLYRAAHSLDREVPEWLEKVLLDRLTRNGFIIGTVEFGQHTPKGATRPVGQWQLRHGTNLYVQHRYQNNFFPSKGARVIVQPKSARFLTKRADSQIFAVAFIPTTKLR